MLSIDKLNKKILMTPTGDERNKLTEELIVKMQEKVVNDLARFCLEKEKKKTCELCGNKDRQVSPVYICDTCSNEHHEKMKKPIEKLYNLNADISLKFIAMKKEPTLEDMHAINKKLGAIINDLRGLVG